MTSGHSIPIRAGKVPVTEKKKKISFEVKCPKPDKRPTGINIFECVSHTLVWPVNR